MAKVQTTEWTHGLQLFSFTIDGLRRGDVRCLAFTDQDKNGWSLCIRPKELEDDSRVFIQLESVPETFQEKRRLPLRAMYKLYLEDLSSRHWSDNSGLAEFWFYVGDESPQSVLVTGRMFESDLPPCFRIHVVLACHEVDVLDLFSARLNRGEGGERAWTNRYWTQLVNQEHTDLQIKVGPSSSIEAHAHMLSAHCEVLAKQIQYAKSKSELSWPQLSLPSATLLLRYLYTGQVPSKVIHETTTLNEKQNIIIETWDMWEEIFIHAHEWMLQDVALDAALHGLLKHLSVQTLERAAHLATTYDIQDFTNGINHFIERQSTLILPLLAQRCLGRKRKADEIST